MIDAFCSKGRFYKGNLHCHSTRSDGQMTPERVCNFYYKAGYDFICLSDHFNEQYGFPITDTSLYRNEEFTTIIGAEIHAGQTEAGDVWHILAVGLPLDFGQTPVNESGPSLAQRALDAGAFVALPHPEWYGITIRDGESMPEGIHAVEMFIFSLSALERPKSGQPGFCLKEPTAFTSKIGFSESFVLEPIGIRPSLELIRSNHSKILGPLVA